MPGWCAPATSSGSGDTGCRQVSAAPDHNPNLDTKAIADGKANSDQALPGPLTWADLDEEVATVLKLLGSGADAPDMAWRVVVRVTRVKRRYLDANLDAATDCLNSFYLDDLDDLDRLTVMDNAGKFIGIVKAVDGMLANAGRPCHTAWPVGRGLGRRQGRIRAAKIFLIWPFRKVKGACNSRI